MCVCVKLCFWITISNLFQPVTYGVTKRTCDKESGWKNKPGICPCEVEIGVKLRYLRCFNVALRES